jgi:hypothetical protein
MSAGMSRSVVETDRHFSGAYDRLGDTAVNSSEKTVNVYHMTRCNTPEDVHIKTRRCEKRKFQPDTEV